MRVLGIDPGSTVTGYGIVEHDGRSAVHIDNGGIRPAGELPLPERLARIYSGLLSIIEEHRPDIAVIEGVFFAKNVRSSITLGQARGAAMLAAANSGLALAEYAPAAVKQAVVGNGRATKHQIQQMVRAILGLPEAAMEDASDALAVAICHCNASRMKGLIAKACGR